MFLLVEKCELKKKSVLCFNNYDRVTMKKSGVCRQSVGDKNNTE